MTYVYLPQLLVPVPLRQSLEHVPHIARLQQKHTQTVAATPHNSITNTITTTTIIFTTITTTITTVVNVATGV